MWFKNWKVKFLFIASSLLILLMILFNLSIMERKKPESVKIWTRFSPKSGDPMDYDLAVHHIAMRSVLASLVSNYKIGEFAPQIGKSWRVNSDKTEWTVFIDKKWTFSNGESVTPEIVVKSFKRILFLKNKENSKSGFLEYLKDADKLKDMKSNIEGISINGDSIIFKFVKPFPEFLEKVSFGIYAVAHPADYSEKDGSWKSQKNFISSGAYEITKWTEKDFVLSLRKNLYVNDPLKRINNIVFSFLSDYEKIHENDLIIREKYNPYIDKNDWRYVSGMQDNNITYVKVMKWNDPKSLLHIKENRTKLRNIFYESMEEAGVSITKSFFPLSIKGVKEFSFEKGDTFDFEQEKFTSQPYFTSKYKKELGNAYREAFNIFCKRINAQENIVDYPENVNDEEKVFDIQFLGTGIVVDSPQDDIKFMFLSQQGIKLPDPTGEIRELLEKDNYDVQQINRLLWEDAIVWPVRHHSMGIWIKNSSKIDESELNTNLHPIDFQFLKWKD